MELRRGLGLGIALGMLFVGCAGVAFPYHYYGLDGVNYSNGVLLGPEPKQDLPFMNCAPSSSSAHPCVVLFAPEWFKLKQDFIDTQTKLIDCEKGRAAK